MSVRDRTGTATAALATVCTKWRRVGRELFNERLGVVLKGVMDGKGKRLEVNVCPVLAAELMVLEPRPRSHPLGLVMRSDCGTYREGEGYGLERVSLGGFEGRIEIAP
jgi:hypothetical protein